MAVWAGARFQRSPKAAFNRTRWISMKVVMDRKEFPPVTTAKIENEQDMVQLVEHALGPPRVGDFAE